MASVKPGATVPNALPAQYTTILEFAEKACQRIARPWPVQVFPVHFHSEWMGIEAQKLGMAHAEIEAAIAHDLPMMTDVKFENLELLISEEAVDLLHELTPTSRALLNPEQFDLEEYLELLSKSKASVQTLALLDAIQTAMNVGNKQIALADAYRKTLQQYLANLTNANPALRTRAGFVEKWLQSRAYEKQVCEYKIQVPDLEYIRSKATH